MSLASMGVRRPVVANLFTGAIIIAGIMFGLTLRREFFPEVRPNEVIVTAPYPGASPDEVEKSLAIKIEDRVDADVDDIKEINSTVSEGVASIRIEFEPGVDIDGAIADVQRSVDALQDLPEESERITVAKFEPTIPVISVSLFGGADERSMKEAMRQMRDDLRSIPGMGEVVVDGVRTDEIVVEVREAALLEHGLSLPEVGRRVRAAMGELPAGAVRTPTVTVGVRAVAFEERAEAVSQIIVAASPDGRPVRLGEIASVRDGFVDVDIATRFNGEPAVSLTTYAKGKEDAVEMAALVRAYVRGRLREDAHLTKFEQRAMEPGARGDPPPRVQAYLLGLSRDVPPGELATHSNIARFIEQRLALLTRNALTGGAVVFLALLLFLRPSLAIWVTTGLIVAVFGTLILMRALDISLNLLTMFGLIIALGMLVDDAIVVAENIDARHDAGEAPVPAAINGTNQVFWPVVGTVTTTIFSFLPLRLIEGRIGDLLGALPLVVGCALIASVLESVFILPSHMAESLIRQDRRRAAGRESGFGRFMAGVRNGIFTNGLLPIYTRALGPCLRARYFTIAVALALLIGSVGVVMGGRLPFNFLGSADSESLVCELRMPIGTPLSETDDVIRRIERACLETPEVMNTIAVVGATFDLEGAPGVSQTHVGQLYIELTPVEERQRLGQRRSDKVIVGVRERLGDLPGVRSLRFDEVQGGPSGRDLAFTVSSDDPARIGPAVERVREILAEFDGVYDLSDDADAGQRELRLTLREGASELGFTVASVAEQMRAAVFGLEAYTFAGDQEDVDVRVMMEPRVRRSLAAVERMRVFTPGGLAAPLEEVVAIEEAEGFATVRRLDRRRAVTVSADVNESVTTAETIGREVGPLLRAVEREIPGVRIIPRGRQEDVQESLSTLPLGMLVAVGLNYVVLVWLFSSYVQPLVILVAVPFSAVGAIWAHVLLGYDMTILSLIGFVALAGIVVNDSIVFMEFYNHALAEGKSALQAALATGPVRLRAIVLTTVTTFLGLSPLMLEQSFQAKFLIPMALTISFGLIAGTFQTLFVLPSLLVIWEDIRRGLRWAWHGGSPPPDERTHQTNSAVAPASPPGQGATP